MADPFWTAHTVCPQAVVLAVFKDPDGELVDQQIFSTKEKAAHWAESLDMMGELMFIPYVVDEPDFGQPFAACN